MYIWNGKYNRYNFDQQYYSTRTLPFFSKRKNDSQVSYVSLKSIVKILHNSAWNHTIVILQPYCTSRALATRTSTEMGGHPVVDWWARRFFTFLASGHHGFGFYMTTWVPISSSVVWHTVYHCFINELYPFWNVQFKSSEMHFVMKMTVPYQELSRIMSVWKWTSCCTVLGYDFDKSNKELSQDASYCDSWRQRLFTYISGLL